MCCSDSSLFSGLRLWLDGLLPTQLLRHTIASHGGTATLTPDSDITHILVDKNRHKPNNNRHWNRPVIDYNWVLESAKRGKRINMRQYMLNENNCTHPTFVENFFKASRLHFLGAWKDHYEKLFHSELKEIVPQFSQKEQAQLAAARVGEGHCYRIVMHIDLDCFFASVAILEHPHLAEKPVAISHCVSPAQNSTGEISTANYIARKYGIYSGMVSHDPFFSNLILFSIYQMH